MDCKFTIEIGKGLIENMYITTEIGRRLTENMGSVCYQKYIGQGQWVFLS